MNVTLPFVATAWLAPPSTVVVHLLFAMLTIDLFVPAFFDNWIQPAVWGVALGAAEALVFHHRWPARLWWILATMAGAIIAGLIYPMLGLRWPLSWGVVYWAKAATAPVGLSTNFIAYVVIRWVIIALAQWPFLGKKFLAGFLWPMLTVIGAALCGVIMAALPREIGSDLFFLIYVLSAGLLIGLVRGLCFVYLKRKAVP